MQKEVDFCCEAKKKLISLWGVNCRQAERNQFLPWGKEKINIAVRRELPSGGKKSIFAVRQRRNRYPREAWIAVRREPPSGRWNRFLPWGKEKIDIAVRRELPSGGKKSIFAVRQRKNWYRREEKLISRWRKIDIAAKKNRLSPWGEVKIDIAAMKKSIIALKIDIAAKEKSAVAESSYQTLEHHLRGEQKRKLCLLDNYLRNSPKL